MRQSLAQNMVHIKKVVCIFILISIIPLGAAIASSGGDYTLDWYTIDGGGTTSTGGNYSLSGSIGQPDAGRMNGGDYALSGGFWEGFVGWIYELFLPLIAR